MALVFPLFIFLATFAMMVFHLSRLVRYKAYANNENRIAAGMLLVTLTLVLFDFALGGEASLRMTLDVSFLLLPFMMLASTLWKPVHIKIVCIVSVGIQLILIVYYVLCMTGVVEMYPEYVPAALSVLYFVNTIVIVVGVYMRVRDIRMIVKYGNALQILSLNVELVYAVFINVVPVLILLDLYPEGKLGILYCVALLLLMFHLAASSIRIATESYFVLMRDHERKIMESMKITQSDSENAGINEVYRQVYERVLEYFECNQPFLDSNLTINDVVKVVFSNKVYISRAISKYTGKNFCQFVNCYRIAYAVKCFRENVDLKIMELAQMSGFNSVVSYNMAFRLFMNENPSEWCRKERAKSQIKKK
jgi:AraC-like DNA-binding protein